jgi:hypothetical protein
MCTLWSTLTFQRFLHATPRRSLFVIQDHFYVFGYSFSVIVAWVILALMWSQAIVPQRLLTMTLGRSCTNVVGNPNFRNNGKPCVQLLRNKGFQQWGRMSHLREKATDRHR